MSSKNDRLLKSIHSGSIGPLPDFSGEWILENEFDGWKIYIVHDPCHDDDSAPNHALKDRNTVISLHESGLWKILGRELPFVMAKKIAHGDPI